ncbi:MAG: hypothetical protein EOP50_16220, partial [Sphingobacteriales bacterium]
MERMSITEHKIASKKPLLCPSSIIFIQVAYMLTRRTFLPCLVLACLLMCTHLIASPAHAANSEAEINALIRAIETSGFQFIRNGDQYTAAQAAEHLRLK